MSMVSSLTAQRPLSLKGKVTLVIGATRGLSKGIALGLGEAEAIVYITGRSIKAADDGIGGSLGIAQTAGRACVHSGPDGPW